jgi:arylamine N-acetyltransferase
MYHGRTPRCTSTSLSYPILIFADRIHFDAICSSQDHTMDVSPQSIYTRFIHTSKGSYCFGQNTLLLGVLRVLGFRAYSGAARVNLWHNDAGKEPFYRSLTHMLLFVQPNPGNEETWVVDVGFGALNLVRPVPLLDGEEERGEVQGAFRGEAHRLTRGAHPNCSLGTSALSLFLLSLDCLSFMLMNPICRSCLLERRQPPYRDPQQVESGSSQYSR